MGEKRILLMCEGPNEEVLLNILLDANALIFNRDNLIGRRPFFLRQLKSAWIRTELKHYGKPVKVFRIGDKQTDTLKIPDDLKHIVKSSEIYKYCTKPELEMLLILNEGLEKEFEKVKTLENPKAFAKAHIKFNGRKYDQSSEFLELYYGGKNVKKLIANLKRYKTYKKHRKKELYIADLLKTTS